MKSEDLAYFDEPDKKIEIRLDRIEKELGEIHELLDKIFGDHVLVGGKFVNLKAMDIDL
jgi:hypothetical protein